MGLDGISVNQLRQMPENSTSQKINQDKGFLNENIKAVDGLSQGQRVDPDKQNKQDKRQLNKQYINLSEDESSEEINENIDVIKYDLSQTDKYILKVDEKTNSILILKKDSQEIIQKLDANNLSRFVYFLQNAQGTLVNRKF